MRNSAGPATLLVEPLVVFPAENFGGVQVADCFGRGAAGFFLGLAHDVVDELLVRELADRVTVFGLMRLASAYLAIAGVGGSLESAFLAEAQLAQVVHFAIAQILFPMLAEIREGRGRNLELAIALDVFRREPLDHRFYSLAQRLAPARRYVARRCALRSGNRRLHLRSPRNLRTATRWERQDQ